MIQFQPCRTTIFILFILSASHLPGICQNCDVDFPGTASRNFSSACGGPSSLNLTLGKNSYLGNGDIFTFDIPYIHITGNVNVNAQGSGKIVIPADVTVDVDGNFQLDSKNSGCSSSNPCMFEIEVNGTLNLAHNFQNNIINVMWSGSGTVVVDDQFKNSSNGCMSCHTAGCPNFQGNSSDCSDNGSSCSGGNFCKNINACLTDLISPVITGCPSNQIVNHSGIGCAQPVSWSPPNASDNCNLSTFSSSHTPGSLFPNGTTTITYTAKDVAGNTSTCSFNVVVVDNTDPIMTGCPGTIIVSADTSCKALVTWTAPTAIDDCEVVTLASSHNPGDTFLIGETQVKYTATDRDGNVSVCIFNVVVKNETLPIISDCPSDIALKGDESGTASANWTIPTASTQCGEVTLVGSHQPGDLFAIGTTKVEYKAVNNTGNTSHCNFNVIVSPTGIEIDVSKVITPNGDGVGDEWIVKNIEKFKDNKVVVVDRWGGVVFNGSNYDNQNVVWQGTNRSGDKVPTGTYFYTISVRYGTEMIEKSGFIELIR